jgi:UDP-glucose:(heptosyl)LPS alpha-1,3-glucosyltransferase
VDRDGACLPNLRFPEHVIVTLVPAAPKWTPRPTRCIVRLSLHPMKIGLVRRGYSSTGGAENYLQRLAHGLEQAGHACVLFGGVDWPRTRWPAHREFVRVPGASPLRFANGLASLQPQDRCDLLFSLERIWTCDCYRAGDGVHGSWLERRARTEAAWRVRLRSWNPKHRQMLALERALFSAEGAGRVIANSHLVEVVYNGLPAGAFQPATGEYRRQARKEFGLEPQDFVVLFAGSGWKRKGLSHALAAVARLAESLRPRLLVAGRGNPKHFLRVAPPSAAVRSRFLGPVSDLTGCYAAADVFVLPTLYDPFSNACLEALASGLPVFTTPANGAAEILTPGVSGEIVETLDAAGEEELAARLTRWADPARLAAAREVCAACAAPLTIEQNVARTIALAGIR